MKKIFFLSFLVTAFVTAQGQSNPENSKGPIIQFEEEVHDFGAIVEGTMAKWDFVFKNTGDKPLLLKEVQPGCGCTASEWTREPILPGQTGKVSATFNSTGYAGRSFQKGITVTTNMKENPMKVIFIKGTVYSKGSPQSVTPPPQSPVRINPN